MSTGINNNNNGTVWPQPGPNNNNQPRVNTLGLFDPEIPVDQFTQPLPWDKPKSVVRIKNPNEELFDSDDDVDTSTSPTKTTKKGDSLDRLARLKDKAIDEKVKKGRELTKTEKWLLASAIALLVLGVTVLATWLTIKFTIGFTNAQNIAHRVFSYNMSPLVAILIFGVGPVGLTAASVVGYKVIKAVRSKKENPQKDNLEPLPKIDYKALEGTKTKNRYVYRKGSGESKKYDSL